MWHREDVNNDGDFVDASDRRWWHCTDAQFSTVALVDDAAVLAERVRYDAYGRAAHFHPYDTDGDRDFDATDRTALSNLIGSGAVPITSGSYDVAMDLDRDGDVDSTDLSIMGTGYTAALGLGALSSTTVGNTIGWDGYVFSAEVPGASGGGMYHVRFRWYEVGLGRWIERDPAGYVDGMGLYEYVGGAPLIAIDPNGHRSIVMVECTPILSANLGQRVGATHCRVLACCEETKECWELEIVGPGRTPRESAQKATTRVPQTRPGVPPPLRPGDKRYSTEFGPCVQDVTEDEPCAVFRCLLKYQRNGWPSPYRWYGTNSNRWARGLLDRCFVRLAEFTYTVPVTTPYGWNSPPRQVTKTRRSPFGALGWGGNGYRKCPCEDSAPIPKSLPAGTMPRFDDDQRNTPKG